MAESRGLAITALALGIVGLFTAGGLGIGSLVGLTLAAVALFGPSSRGGRDVAWAALAANLMALATILPLAAALFAYRASPLAFQSDDSLPVPATPHSIEDVLPEAVPPTPPLPPPRANASLLESEPDARSSPNRPGKAMPKDTARSKDAVDLERPVPTPVRIGGAIKEPRKTRQVNPVYPKEAVAARIQGVVILECTISPEGKVVQVKTLRSVPMLEAAAVEAVKQWEYTPTLLNGAPVPVIMTVTVNFKLS